MESLTSSGKHQELPGEHLGCLLTLARVHTLEEPLTIKREFCLSGPIKQPAERVRRDADLAFYPDGCRQEARRSNARQN